jgi:ankyrin repeat protein
MGNQALFVPVEESTGKTAGYTSLPVSLYEVAAYPADQEDAWLINGVGPGEIQKKIKAYFELHPDSQDIPAALMLKGQNLIDFTGSMQSVTLGLFIGFMRFLRHREFRSGWETLTLTGDLRPHGDRVYLYPVEHIKEKYAGVQAYADAHPDQRHLFLYVSDENPPPVPEGRRGNVEVRAFNSRHALGALLAFLFEPFFNDEQRRFIDAAGLHCTWDYVPTAAFERLKEAALADGWQGFFIHGEGESGKSAMALELAKYLMNAGRIYAPVWVMIDKERLQEYIQKWKQSNDKERLTDIIAGYIAELAASNLQIADWTHKKDFGLLAQALSRDGGIPYLFVVDNLELDLADEVLEAVQNIAERGNQKVPVILTSRIRGSGASLKTVSPSELNADEIEQLVLNIAQGQEYEQDLKSWKETDEYRDFLEQLHRHFGSLPGIIPVIVEHLYLGLPTVLRNIAMTGGDIFAKAETIYKMAYESLDIYTRIVLFAFIGVTKPWMNFGQDESLKKHSPDFSGQDDDLSISQKIMKHIAIMNHINKSRIRVDGRRLEIWEIEEKIPAALEQLQRRHIFYRAGSGNDAQDSQGHYLKSLALKTFLFSDVIGNEKTADAGKTLRDMLIYIGDIITACIYYNQSPSRLEALLKKNDDRWHRDYSFLYTAASYSVMPAHIYLLVSHGYRNINKASGVTGRQTPLHFAAYSNPNRDVIAKLLSYKANINAKDVKGKTPLHLAALNNRNPAVASLLLNKGACLTTPDNNGQTPVHYAALNKKSDIFKLFLEQNPDLLYIPDSDGLTPLYDFAMSGRDPTLISWLIDRGVNINTPGPNGSTPLHYAALNENEAVFLELLNRGADIQARDSEGSTVFHCVAMNSGIDLMEQDITAILLDKGLSIHATNVNGMTPLHFAAAYNDNPDAVALLLERGAGKDINTRAIGGITPLYCAAMSNEAPDIISVLIANGADIHATADGGIQPIHIAAATNTEPGVISILLANGADVNAKDMTGMTPLHYAADNNESIQVVIALIQTGANLEEKDHEGKTPLYHLKKRKDWSRIKRFI